MQFVYDYIKVNAHGVSKLVTLWRFSSRHDCLWEHEPVGGPQTWPAAPPPSPRTHHLHTLVIPSVHDLNLHHQALQPVLNTFEMSVPKAADCGDGPISHSMC
jgi:hypothetical protein